MERMTSRRRVILFRLAAILLGLAPFVLAELIFVALNWGHPNDQLDLYVEFTGTKPLFVLSDDGERREIPLGRQSFFRPESFAARKADDEYRVFCLGGSTVQGRPYAIETSFTTWLELSLQTADPSRTWEVVNCGGVSYASYRLAPILDEVLDYKPDLVILYTGHNEFLEDRTYESVKRPSPAFRAAWTIATRARIFNVAREVYGRVIYPDPEPLKKDLLPEEVEARLDYRGGLDKYHRDDTWRANVVEHFRFNIHRIVSRCQQAGVPIWIVDPVCNLRDCPPFKSELRKDIRPEESERWEELRHEASEFYRSDMAKALGLLKEALTIDNQHAGLWYDVAKCHESIGQFELARGAYMRSKELDICPLRIIEPLREVLLEVAQVRKTPVIPVYDLFVKQCEHGIPGGFLLVDHVHPSISGHQMVAELMIDEMIEQGIVTPQDDWQAARDQRYKEHIATLGDPYYFEGQRRLRGLQSWAQGRSTRED